MSDENRLDRIEALIELLGQKVESNARAIEASHQEFLELRQQWELDRSRLYKMMADLASAQGSLHEAQARFYEAQASFYKRLEEADERQEQFERQQNERQERFERQQGDIVEILKLLTQQNRQQS
jgi:chromosome segregation ATPase